MVSNECLRNQWENIFWDAAQRISYNNPTKQSMKEQTTTTGDTENAHKHSKRHQPSLL